jgi:homocysteine S-methyltransferase
VIRSMSPFTCAGAVQLMPTRSRPGIASAAASLPVIVYPNAGGTWDSLSGHWLGVTHEDIVRCAREWRDHGATWIGGCCGTEADGIRAISEALRGA